MHSPCVIGHRVRNRQSQTKANTNELNPLSQCGVIISPFSKDDCNEVRGGHVTG